MPGKGPIRFGVVPVALALISGAALAGDTTSIDERISRLRADARRPIAIRIDPGVWVARLRGSAALGDVNRGAYDVDGALGLDRLEPSPNIELSVRDQDVDLRLTAFNFSTGRSETLGQALEFGTLDLQAADRVSSSFDMTSVAFEASWLFLPSGDEQDSVFAVGPMLGLRHIDIEHSVRPIGGSREKASLTSAAVYAGGRLHCDLSDAFLFDVYVGAGPCLSGGSMFELGADVTWKPAHNIGISIGYRLFELIEFEEDDFLFDGRLAGMYGAVSIQF